MLISHSDWQPLPLDTLRKGFRDSPFNWCLGGGYAVEMFVGHVFRSHSDIDVVIFRDQQLAVQSHLENWQLYAADPPGHLRRWNRGEFLPEGIHDIWGHRQGVNQWELQLMVQEVSGGRWYYRRDRRVSGDVAEFVEEYEGWPCIKIELQLLYKSKGLRPKDEDDFQRCLPLLDQGRKQRLSSHLSMVYPDGHPWLTKLRQT